MPNGMKVTVHGIAMLHRALYHEWISTGEDEEWAGFAFWLGCTVSDVEMDHHLVSQ